MASPHEQPEPEMPTEAGIMDVNYGFVPLDRVPQTDMPGLTEAEQTPPRLTFEEYEARGDRANHLAREHEKAHGLDDRAAELYWEASRNLLSATGIASSENLEDPIRTLKIAGSLDKVVAADKVPPYSEPQYDPVTRQEIDRTENIRRISRQMLVDAGRMFLVQDAEVVLIPEGEFDGVKPSEVFVEAAVEAVHETGTGEHVIPGMGRLEDQTPQKLEAGGEAAILKFADKLGEQPGVVGETAELLVEELEHARKVPIAA